MIENEDWIDTDTTEGPEDTVILFDELVGEKERTDGQSYVSGSLSVNMIQLVCFQMTIILLMTKIFS